MATWWRASYLGIETYEVVKVTAKTVVYIRRWHDWMSGQEKTKEQRESRGTSDSAWFDNERDAVEHIRARLEARVTSTSVATKIAREKLAAFNEKHPVALSPESTSRKELLVGTFYLQDWSALPLETLEAIVALLTPEPASED